MSRPQRFKHFRSVTVFGWSESRPEDPVYEAAREVGGLLARHGLTVVSGGFGGEMEAAARGAKEGGGKTIGVTFNPMLATKFEAGTGASSYLDHEIKTGTYLERTLKLIALGDAFIAARFPRSPASALNRLVGPVPLATFLAGIPGHDVGTSEGIKLEISVEPRRKRQLRRRLAPALG